MRKLNMLVFALVINCTLFAGNGIKFESLKWKEVKAKALKEKKMIFFDAFASWCGPCKYMEENIYTDEKAAQYFNANFINVKIDMELGEGPGLSEEFGVGAYPTFLFFTPDGKLVHKFTGAMEIDEFLELGKNAQLPEQQYFTLKNKAKAGLLNDAGFLRWVEQADKLEDEDKDELVNKYLAGKKDIFANKEIMSVVIYHAVNSDQTVTRLLKERARLSALMNWDSASASLELYNLVFSNALKSFLNNHSSVDSFVAKFTKLYPVQAEMARDDIKYRIALFIEGDSKKTMDLLTGYLGELKNQVPLKTIFLWIIQNSDQFKKEDFVKLDAALLSHKARVEDNGQECWLYLMQVLAAVKLENAVKAKEYAIKAYQHKNLPEFYKEDLKTNYDLK